MFGSSKLGTATLGYSSSSIADDIFAIAASPGPLAQPSVLTRIPVYGMAYTPGPLSPPQAKAWHDFTAQLGDVATLYVMDLITPTGTVRVPISSWQATLQTGASNYVQCVIPACTPWNDAINAATVFVVYRAAQLPDGSSIEYEMARAPSDQAQFDRGPSRETCTMSGYSPAFAASENPPTTFDRELSGIRSISSGSSYRVRSAVDWLLRPGHRALAGGAPFVVKYINYYVMNEFDAYMDAGS